MFVGRLWPSAVAAVGAVELEGEHHQVVEMRINFYMYNIYNDI